MHKKARFQKNGPFFIAFRHFSPISSTDCLGIDVFLWHHMDNMILLKGINFGYFLKNRKDLAIRNISMKFPDNGMVFLLGPSGSGKTTLLNIIGCLLEPTSGEIYYGTTPLSSLTKDQKELFRLQTFSFIFQENNLVPEYSVAENLILSKKIRNEPSSKNLSEITRLCQIEGFLKRQPNQLSTGQKQRVCIARALMNDTPIILGDEPTGSLDSLLSDEIFALLKEVSKTHLVILASHDRKAAFKYGDTVYEIKDKTIPLPIEEVSDTISKTPLLSSNTRTPFSFTFGLSLKGMKRHRLFFGLSLLISFLFGAIFASFSSFYTGKSTTRYVETLYRENLSHIQFQSGNPSANLNDEAVESLASEQGFVSVAFTKNDPFVSMETPSGNHVDTLTGIALYTDSVAEQYPLIYGNLPSMDYQEVLITLETYETLSVFGFIDNTPVASYADVIGKYLPSGEIVGIIDTHASPTEEILHSQHNFYYIHPQAMELFLESPFSSVYRIDGNASNYDNYPVVDSSDSQLTEGIQISPLGESESIVLVNEHQIEDGFIMGASDSYWDVRNAANTAITEHVNLIWNAEMATDFSLVSGIASPTAHDYYQYIVTQKSVNEVEEGVTFDSFFATEAQALVSSWPRTANLLIQPQGTNYYKKESIAIVGYDFESSEKSFSSLPVCIMDLYRSTKQGSIDCLSYRLSGNFKQDLAAIEKALAVVSTYPELSSDQTHFALIESFLNPIDNSLYAHLMSGTQPGSSLFSSVLMLTAAGMLLFIILIGALLLVVVMADKERNGILLSLGLSKKNLKLSYVLQTLLVCLISLIPTAILSIFFVRMMNTLSFALTGLVLFELSAGAILLGLLAFSVLSLATMMIISVWIDRLKIADVVKRDF